MPLQGAIAAQLRKQRGAAGRRVGFHNSDHACEGPVCKDAKEITRVTCSKHRCQHSIAPPPLQEKTQEDHGRYPTGDGELHSAGGEAKGVSCYALVSALVSHAEVLNGKGPVLAYVELATLCDLDTLLSHHQKTENVSGHGKLPIIPAFNLFSKPADGCDELVWPPDVSIALPKKPESHPRTSAPAWTHYEEVLAQLLHPGPPPGTRCRAQTSHTFLCPSYRQAGWRECCALMLSQKFHGT